MGKPSICWGLSGLEVHGQLCQTWPGEIELHVHDILVSDQADLALYIENLVSVNDSENTSPFHHVLNPSVHQISL